VVARFVAPARLCEQGLDEAFGRGYKSSTLVQPGMAQKRRKPALRKTRRLSHVVSFLLSLSMILAGLLGFGLGPARAVVTPPPGGGGYCPPEGSLLILSGAFSYTATTFSIQFALTSASLWPFASATVEWGPTTSYGFNPVGSLGPFSIGTWPTGYATASGGGLRPDSAYVLEVLATGSCTSSSGTVTDYSGALPEHFTTPKAPTYTEIQSQGSMTYTYGTLHGIPVSCTMSIGTTLEMNSIDQYSSGTGKWGFSQGPWIYTTIQSSGSCLYFSVWNETFSVTNNVYDSSGDIGRGVSWDILFTFCDLTNSNCHHEAIGYNVDYYSNPQTPGGATGTFTENFQNLDEPTLNGATEIIMLIIEVSLE